MKRLLLFFALTCALTWACFITVAVHPMPAALRQSLILLGAFALTFFGKLHACTPTPLEEGVCFC